MARDTLDHKRLVRLFAERVIGNATLEPDAMPELAKQPAFVKMTIVEKAAVARAIRRDAVPLLVTAGYPEAKVKRILRV